MNKNHNVSNGFFCFYSKKKIEDIIKKGELFNLNIAKICSQEKTYQSNYFCDEVHLITTIQDLHTSEQFKHDSGSEHNDIDYIKLDDVDERIKLIKDSNEKQIKEVIERINIYSSKLDDLLFEGEKEHDKTKLNILLKNEQLMKNKLNRIQSNIEFVESNVHKRFIKLREEQKKMTNYMFSKELNNIANKLYEFSKDQDTYEFFDVYSDNEFAVEQITEQLATNPALIVKWLQSIVENDEYMSSEAKVILEQYSELDEKVTNIKANFNYDEQKTISEIYEILNSFSIEEYESSIGPIKDWSDIGLAYTEAGNDNQYPVQCTLNMRDKRISTIISLEDEDVLFESIDFDTYDELKNYLSNITFDELIAGTVSYCEEYEEQYENETDYSI